MGGVGAGRVGIAVCGRKIQIRIGLVAR